MKGNARIKSTMLGYEDHGILTCSIQLEQDGTGQGFGGWRLDAPPQMNKGNSDEACRWIKSILDVVGVLKWEDLVGKYVRVDGEKWGAIEGIGNIVSDKWFYPRGKVNANAIE